MPLMLGCCCSIIACLCSCLQIQDHLKLYFALVFALQKNNNICLGKKTCPSSLQFRELNTINFHGLPILENYLGLPFAGRGDSGGPSNGSGHTDPTKSFREWLDFSSCQVQESISCGGSLWGNRSSFMRIFGHGFEGQVGVSAAEKLSAAWEVESQERLQLLSEWKHDGWGMGIWWRI